jgi:hypothetical protein
MSGLTQAEVLSKHKQSLSEGRDACLWLAKNQDPEYIAARGRHYKNLRTALKELEGTCRQLSMMREDARYTKLGMVYAKAMLIAHKHFLRQNWRAFKQLSDLFIRGLVEMENLSTRKTGTFGPILPQRPSDWIIMPEVKPAQRLWTPQGRQMN